MANSPNRLLSSLPQAAFEALETHLKPFSLNLGKILAEAGDPVTQVYFPHSGVISLVVEMRAGQVIETAMVGRDGAFNGAAALDGKLSLNKGIVQLGGFSSMIDVDRLRSSADDFPALRSLLIRHEQVLFAHSQQSAACNAVHLIEARLCKWLSQMRHLAESDDLTVTQEFLAQMIGATRPSVSIVANTLQKAGLIQYVRGNIRILDPVRLEEASCECYGVVKAHYDRMLGFRKH